MFTKPLLLALALASVFLVPGMSPSQEPQRTKIIVDRLDSFRTTDLDKEQAILDNFAVALMNWHDQIGYIIVYAGRSACAGAAQARGMRMKKYLVERRHIPWDRVIWKDAGHLDEPYVLLELQLRGGPWYEYSYPTPLAANQVRIVPCTHGANRRRKRAI